MNSLLSVVRARAPQTGGSFAVWGGLFSSFDCMLAYCRGTEDPWNAIASGAITGSVLSIRRGVKQAMVAGAIGGLLLAMIEGAMFALNRQTPHYGEYMPPPEQEAIEDDSDRRSLLSWRSGSASPPAQTDDGSQDDLAQPDDDFYEGKEEDDDFY